MVRVGLCSTLTSSSSRALVDLIATEVETGRIPGVEIAYLLCNRAAGESAETDESVALIGAGHAVPLFRVSAVAFEKEARRDARRAEEAGDPAPLMAWRDAFYASYADRLPASDLDLLLGDMWIWGPAQCAERNGLNLHPALPGGPAGMMWFDVIWDLILNGAEESGAMLHRVTPEVDLGPVVSYTWYSLRAGEMQRLWEQLPDSRAELERLVEVERPLKRASDHPLFHAIRREGAAREPWLLLATVAAVAGGRIEIDPAGVNVGGRPNPGGVDLTREVDAMLQLAGSRPVQHADR